ncbi:MAG: hypothetical protein AAF789_02135, partial [Bacteroidota bacterium]
KKRIFHLLSGLLISAFALTFTSCSEEDEEEPELCSELCQFTNDDECDDGGTGSITSLCDFGTDCIDCGPR